MQQVEHVLSVNNRLGESPVWSAEEQALYWVDIEQHRFFRYVPASGNNETFEVDVPIGVLALRTQGGFVMATGQGFAFWDHEKGLHHFANPQAEISHTRFNDGAVDCQGRFWAGTMCGLEPPRCSLPEGNLYRLDPDGSISTMETDIFITNGVDWSPDNTTMYLADTPRRVIYAYDFDAATGSITNRRILITTAPDRGFPDGLTVDSKGFIWSACWGGWRIIRYDPSGKVEREIELPVACPTSCIFGGENLDELYITSAWTELSEQQRKQQPLAGDIFRVKTGIKGLESQKFAG